MSLDAVARGLALRALGLLSGAVPGGGLPPSYLGQIGTRCMGLPRSANAGINNIMSRSVHFMRDKSTQHTAVFLNGRIVGQVDTPGLGTGTLKVAVEYPTGVYTLANECIAAGNTGVPFPVGLMALTFNVFIPKHAKVRYRSYFYCASGVVWFQYQSGYICPTEEGCELGGGVGTDKTTSGTVGAASNIVFAPILILAQTRQPSLVIFGTSREEAGTESLLSDGNYNVGMAGRAVGATYGYTSLAMSASLAAGWNGGTRTYRDQIVNGTIPGVGDGVTPYFSHGSNEYGVNDLAAGDTAATLAGRRTTMAALYPKLTMIGQTLPPYNGPSTDGFRTKAGQSGWGTSGINFRLRDFNDLERAGIAGESFYWDVADGIDPFREGKYPVTRDPAATDVPQACTFVATLSGVTLTVSSITSGSLPIGAPITDNLTALGLVRPGTTITGQVSGTANGVGVYTVNYPHGGGSGFLNPVASSTMYVGVFATGDGLHWTEASSLLALRRRACNLDLMTR